MTEREALNMALQALETLMIERGSIYDKATTAIREALMSHSDGAQPEQHQDWCASLTQMLMSMPPKPAPCNCKPKPEPLPWIDKMVIDVPNQILYTAPQRKEPEQERFLVATIGNWGRVEWADGVFPSIGDKMYSAPPKWVGLTEAQCGVLWKTNMTPFEYYQAIEAKLKEKNT